MTRIVTPAREDTSSWALPVQDVHFGRADPSGRLLSEDPVPAPPSPRGDWADWYDEQGAPCSDGPARVATEAPEPPCYSAAAAARSAPPPDLAQAYEALFTMETAGAARAMLGAISPRAQACLDRARPLLPDLVRCDQEELASVRLELAELLALTRGLRDRAIFIALTSRAAAPGEGKKTGGEKEKEARGEAAGITARYQMLYSLAGLLGVPSDIASVPAA